MGDKKDLQILESLLANYQKRFIRFASAYIKSEAIAEDFVIEAIMQYWEKRDTLHPGSNIPAYILTIIKYKCLNYLQHLQVRQEATDKMKKHTQWEMQTRITSLQACEPEELFTEEAQAIVDKTLNSLPEQTRKIFLMSRYENKSYKEIATHFNLTIKGVEFHLSKALKALRESLRDYLPLFIYLFM